MTGDMVHGKGLGSLFCARESEMGTWLGTLRIHWALGNAVLLAVPQLGQSSIIGRKRDGEGRQSERGKGKWHFDCFRSLDDLGGFDRVTLC